MIQKYKLNTIQKNYSF